MAESIDDKLAQVSSHQLRVNRKKLQDYIGENLGVVLQEFETELRSDTGKIEDINKFTESIKTALVDSLRNYLKAEAVSDSDINFYKIWERDVLAMVFNFDPKTLKQSLIDNQYDFDEIRASLISTYKDSAMRYLDRDSSRLIEDVLASSTGVHKLHDWAKEIVAAEPRYELTGRFMQSKEPSQILTALRPFFMEDVSQYFAKAKSSGLLDYKVQ